MNTAAPWIGADEAARRLGVTRATLYAYVSRGFVRSQPAPGSPRERRYAREDVERLRRRTEERRDPDKAAARALQWGTPVLESAIAFIDGRRLFYRGHDAVALARSRSIQEVASLIWTGRFDTPVSDGHAAPAAVRARSERRYTGPPPHSAPGDLPFVARAQARLAAAAPADPGAYDLRPDAVTRTGWRLLRLLTATAVGRDEAPSAIDAALARAWRVNPAGADLLRQALILCADHELNVSAFTARCVASAGSHPYAVVVAGLAALEGTRHGGASARAEAMLASMRRAPRLRGAVADRLRRGEAIDGFGHPLYRGGDPRADALLALLQDRTPPSPERAYVSALAAAVSEATREAPNLDFALAAVSRVLRLPPGSALTIFAIGRTIGWIGHAIEQYATGQLIRPRAKYVGVVPGISG